MSLERVARQNEETRRHLARTRERLANGRATIERLQVEIEATNRHISSITDWIDETERALGRDRARQTPRASGYSWKQGST